MYGIVTNIFWSFVDFGMCIIVTINIVFSIT